MRTRESIDANRLEAFEALIWFFLTMGMAGVIYLLVLVALAAVEWLQNAGLWLALVGIPLAGVIMSAAGLVTCLRWLAMA